MYIEYYIIVEPLYLFVDICNHKIDHTILNIAERLIIPSLVYWNNEKI
jgi:hypothetical protein